MKVLVASCLLLFLSSPAMAKCFGLSQGTRGVVVDASGKPIEGAFIQARRLWQVPGKRELVPGVIEEARSDYEGRVSLMLHFDAYSGEGPYGEDQCTAKSQEFVFTVSKLGFIDAQRTIRTTGKLIEFTFTLQPEKKR